MSVVSGLKEASKNGTPVRLTGKPVLSRKRRGRELTIVGKVKRVRWLKKFGQYTIDLDAGSGSTMQFLLPDLSSIETR